ncbi:hypothetical protein OG562_03295 [Streptomyces sp. NBC_01275]|uniref:hypothetical protein n=1 Tax=Streptomyces sp. NBC_01275 TaxID=2903807 RepID=UPI0022526991|nr:hypothetical protein [Streptomyces sp. NBC_01275]MCX4760031.1 hypothetical protein [Streptomyces sp. NBC_01275]
MKIGSFGMEAGRTSLPRRFEALEPDFFSLGTDESCYATLLDEFDDETRLAIFSGLCDVAHDAELFEQACNEPVMRDSLLRGTDADTVTVIGRPVGGEPTINDEADGVRWILPGELDSYDIHHSMRKQIAHYLDGTFPHVD